MSTVQIVGVLNTTPDSYFDGGQYNHIESALSRVEAMRKQGADIIDVGGQSSGPGSVDVEVTEEIERTIPIIKAIKKQFPDQRVSIDTFQAEVARQAIEAGVDMVNDVTAGRGDSEMFSIVADADVDVVLMYAKDDSARTTVDQLQYDDVVDVIKSFLTERKQAAIDAGVDASRIILDPGMGHFISSDSQYSLEVIRRLGEFADLGCPLYVSPSRKSCLAGSENLPPADRLPGTIAASAIAVVNGASFIRTHDVVEVRRGCEIAIDITHS